MGIGNFGLTEIVAIVVLVLIFFGPKELPEIIRTLARLFRDLRRSVNEVVREFDELQRVDEDGGGPGGRRERERSPRPGERVLPPEARERSREAEAGGEGQEEAPAVEEEAGPGPGAEDGADDRT